MKNRDIATSIIAYAVCAVMSFLMVFSMSTVLLALLGDITPLRGIIWGAVFIFTLCAIIWIMKTGKKLKQQLNTLGIDEKPECNYLECDAGMGLAGKGVCHRKGNFRDKNCKKFSDVTLKEMYRNNMHSFTP